MELATKILSEITTNLKYAKFLEKQKRRETWDEICTRYQNMLIDKYPALELEIINNMQYVRKYKVLPSMRALQFAGAAIEKNPARIYNCAFMPADDLRAFSETMFLLLGGTGTGYSVQFHDVEMLPPVKHPERKAKRFLIEDSIEGWADAIYALVESYTGHRSSYFLPDFSNIREKGAQLVTAGGKAPGAEPLRVCIEEIRRIFERHVDGEELSTIEVHDIMCHIANAVLAGGIRRAAMIALFSFFDEKMRKAKFDAPVESIEVIDQKFDENGELVYIINAVSEGVKYINKRATEWDLKQFKEKGTFGWWVLNEQRGRANNSAVIVRGEITKEQFNEAWTIVKLSGCGEFGLYFTNDKYLGTNPCCEISLRRFQFCNLTELNGSDAKTQHELNERARVAAFFGTLQAGFTDFHYLRSIWQDTTEEEALIGVGITGIGSGAILNLNLKEAAEVVKAENKRVALIIGINPAARTTTVKPSGTSSLVLGTSSGIHAWFAEYYFRTIRIGKNEPIYAYLKEHFADLIEDDYSKPDIQAILTIPQKAPEGAILRSESVFDMLERTKRFNLEWVREGHRSGGNTNNVSATAYIKWDEENGVDEWPEVGEWIWNNQHTFNGMSVLPYDGGTYKQAPFQDCTKEQYEALLPLLKGIDLTQIVEDADYTNFTQEAACAGGACLV